MVQISGVHQLRLVYPIIHKVSKTSQVVFSPDFWTINYIDIAFSIGFLEVPNIKDIRKETHRESIWASPTFTEISAAPIIAPGVCDNLGRISGQIISQRIRWNNGMYLP